MNVISLFSFRRFNCNWRRRFNCKSMGC